MISSLKSKFRPAGKRVFFLSADKLRIFHWRGAALEDPLEFGTDEVSLADFEQYLAAVPLDPVYMLVDLISEEYRQDTIPHVFGADRRALIQRKQARLFRNAPYCHAVMQGRMSDGRRDDQVLLMALTKSDLVDPWMRRLKRYQVPVAGIYSLPLFSEQLLPKFELSGANVLLVSLHHTSGLRHSFYSGGALKISRLAPLPRAGKAPRAEYVLGEMQKLRRYLNSLRFLTPNEPLNIAILSHGWLLDELREQCADTEHERYHLLDIFALAAKLQLKGEFKTPYADTLFAHLLINRTPENHYAVRGDTAYFSLFKARRVMYIAALVIWLAVFGWSGFNVIDGITLHQQILDAGQRAGFYQDRYDIAKQKLPPTPVDAMDIQSGVSLATALAGYKTQPWPVLVALSQALENFPGIQVDTIEWKAALDPAYLFASEVSANSSAMEQAEEPRGGQDMNQWPYYQLALIEAHIAPFDGNYRAALDTVNAFVEYLSTIARVERVSAIELPLNISSGSSLRGDAMRAAVSDKSSASFSVKLVLGVVDGKAG